MQKHYKFRPFQEKPGRANLKPKFCLICGNKATQEALFNVDEGDVLEKYCDVCAKNVNQKVK
jgi:hypothetical protein